MAGLRLGVEAAVRKAVFVEGLAADLALEEKGEHRATARDVLDYLPRAVGMDLLGLSVALKERYRGARIV
jgi:NAD(P)H-hydrate repair Nnr-like enzyme with NAD(P)H-hydrate dehydratase domain